MLEITESIVLFLVLLISAVSYMGFRRHDFLERYLFETDAILVRKQYYRLFSSGFVHANWLHLIFNILALYSFGNALGFNIGIEKFLLIFLASLLGGNLFALYIHRQHGDYKALGASGAVSGVAFAFIVMFPDRDITFIFFEGFAIKAWLFGVLYMALSIYGVKMQSGNICHEGHVGGAITGVVTILIMDPTLLTFHPFVIAGVVLPFVVFLFLIVKRPEVLLVDNYWGMPVKKKRQGRRKEHVRREDLLNELLDKVSKKGVEGLTKEEREQLEELSKLVN